MFVLVCSLQLFLFSFAGLKATNGNAFTDMGLVSGGVAVEGGMADGGEESVRMLQRENGRLQEQLRGSEELNATLRSELDLTRSILEHNPQSQTEDKQPEQQQQQQNTSASKTINSGRAHTVFACDLWLLTLDNTGLHLHQISYFYSV